MESSFTSGTVFFGKKVARRKRPRSCGQSTGVGGVGGVFTYRNRRDEVDAGYGLRLAVDSILSQWHPGKGVEGSGSRPGDASYGQRTVHRSAPRGPPTPPPRPAVPEPRANPPSRARPSPSDGGTSMRRAGPLLLALTEGPGRRRGDCAPAGVDLEPPAHRSRRLPGRRAVQSDHQPVGGRQADLPASSASGSVPRNPRSSRPDARR